MKIPTDQQIISDSQQLVELLPVCYLQSSHLVSLGVVRLHVHDAVAVNLVGAGAPGDSCRIVGHIREAQLPSRSQWS